MKFLDIIKRILIGIWVIVAIFVTVCLLSYNKFNISVIGKTTLLIIDNNELKPDLKSGDLVLVKKDLDKNIVVGDKVFFYNGNKAKEILINLGDVTDKTTVNDTETTFEIEGKPVSKEYVIGKFTDSKKIAYLGLALKIFESRWGYLFLVILPTLFAFVYEIFKIVEEVKSARKDHKEL